MSKIRGVYGSDIQTNLNVKVIRPLDKIRLELEKIITELEKEHWAENLDVYKFKQNLKDQHEKLMAISKGWKKPSSGQQVTHTDPTDKYKTT
jgi:hypothetical protein